MRFVVKFFIGLIVFLLVLISGYGFLLYSQASIVFDGIIHKSAPLPHQSVFLVQKLLKPFGLIQDLPLLIGLTTDRHYVVLFQNNMELRPTGGFMGSYATITFHQGKLDTVQIQDIYVPDGQIKGYVKEPEAIKKYLFNDNYPGWRLRDANWNPDFPESTKAIDWFFNEGHLPKVDGYVAVNLFPIVDLLRLTGGIPILDYDQTITADNFYGEAQRHAEEGFFPGSTQKRDFLSSVGTTLLSKLLEDHVDHNALMQLLYKNITQKHIFISIPGTFGPNWKKNGWDGSVKETNSDYVMIVEANVGSTKSNCCIDRSLVDIITTKDNVATHLLTLSYQNNNPPTPQPPYQWGGGYKNYLRLMVPQQATVQSIEVDGVTLPTDRIDEEVIGTKKSVGFLVLTEGGKKGQVIARYSVPFTGNYSLLFQKQSGIEAWPVAFSINKKVVKELVTTDRLYKL